MKTIFFSLIAMLFVNSAFATTYKGKCAKAAEESAVRFWANVPEPDPNLEYSTVSSEATAVGSDTYLVVLAFSDGNESAYGKYTVTFRSLNSCTQATAALAK